MSQLVAIIIVLVGFSSYVEGTTVHGRLTGLFDNFGDDYNVPPDIIGMRYFKANNLRHSAYKH